MNRLRFISALLLGACLVHAQRGDEREVLFAPGAAQFNPDQRVLLDAVDELVRNRADRALLTYRSGFSIPEELALERARAVRQFLIDHGVREDRIRLRSEDPGNPVDTNAPRGVGLRLTYYTAAIKAIPRPPALPPGVKGFREVFFATDRLASGTAAFANQASPDEKTTYGRVLISIPKSHQVGELERPWSLFSFTLSEDASEHLVISSRQTLPLDDFHGSVRQAIDESPEKSAFVFVHGFNVNFDEAVLRAGQLAWDLHFRGPAVAYSWPSSAATLGYVSDIEMADWTAPHLAAFLQSLRANTGARTIHLIAHSMGSRVLTKALDRLTVMHATAHFQEIVLAAPDLNAAVFKQLSNALRQSGERVTVYSSRRDLALKLSAALRGEPIRTGAATGNAASMTGIDMIDATKAATSLLGHSYFAESPQILKDLGQLLLQRDAPSLRSQSLKPAGVMWTLR